MELDLKQIKELIDKPLNKESIDAAITHEARLRLHTSNAMSSCGISSALNEFLKWVKTLIPDDKYRVFLSLLRFPTPNIQFTKTIFTELKRVYDGRNAVASYQFEDTRYRNDWEKYRKEELKEPSIWRNKGWEVFKSAINSVLIVDTPAEQTGEFPEPYFYWLGIENVIDYGLNDEGEIKYIIFKQSDGKLAEMDSTYTRVLKLEDDVLSVVTEVKHGLGYCPARFYWDTPLINNQEGVKESPLSSQLANLDWLLFFTISKRHLDLYAPYPIYSAYEQDCDFVDASDGSQCDGGFLRDKNGDYMMLADGTLRVCPICSAKNAVGVGSYIEVPAPNAGEPDLRNPVSITSVDSESLDYNVREVKRLEKEIFENVVGTGGGVQEKESINELQVTANFETKISVLNALKGNLEAAQKFVDDTICRLRYGDSFTDSSISYGTEFFIYTVDDLYRQYTTAKKNGASESELDAINNQIIATSYKNDPVQLQRMLILRQLEPYRHYTFDELMTLKEADLLDPELLKVKINFSTFVERFERENASVTEFGNGIPFDEKIKRITKKLKDYGDKQQRVIE